MDIEQLKDDLLRDEGFKSYAYQDHLGFWTIGIGRLIDKRKGGGITLDEAMHLLDNDVRTRTQELYRALPWVTSLPEPWMRALGSMAFQMGLQGLLGFKKMLAALEAGDGAEAYRQALDSLYARQTPMRAQRVAKLFLEPANWHQSEDTLPHEM